MSVFTLHIYLEYSFSFPPLQQAHSLGLRNINREAERNLQGQLDSALLRLLGESRWENSDCGDNRWVLLGCVGGGLGGDHSSTPRWAIPWSVST